MKEGGRVGELAVVREGMEGGEVTGGEDGVEGDLG